MDYQQDSMMRSATASSSRSGSPKEQHHVKGHHPTPLPDLVRAPIWACVPNLAKSAHNLVMGEARTVQKAVTGFPSWSQDYVGDSYTFYKSHPRILYNEILSGFTVAIMQVPESIAFSFVAGVPPLSGLHATFWMGTITGLMGGKPGMISGAAGALAVVVADLTVDDGVLKDLSIEERWNVLYMTMLLCGLFQILFAVLRMAKLVRLIPETGMIGFMNGLAIIIFMAQLPAFQKCPSHDLFVECTIAERTWLTFGEDTWPLILSLIHVAICMAIMKFFPQVPKIGKLIPASLLSLLVGTLLEHALFRPVFDVATRTVEETAPMSGRAPQFDWPALPNNTPEDLDLWKTILVFAITLAAIGSIESVLTLQACNEITDTVPKISSSNQELFAQGLANCLCGIFRAMGGDAMIGQSTINIMNGARHRVSSTSSGLFMLLFVIAISPFIELLPVATLTGVLFMVVLSTFQWKTFMILRYGRLSDSAVIVIVTVIAVLMDLAVAIGVGIVVSALVHAWDSGNHVSADISYKPMMVNGEFCPNVKYVHMKGSIFFGSSRHFVSLFSVTEDPDTVIVDMKDALILDHSAVAAIQGMTHRFAQAGKRVLITNVPLKSHGRLERTGDHAVLKRQLTNVSDLRDVEGGKGKKEHGENEVDEEEVDEPEVTITSLEHHADDEGETEPLVVRHVGDLAMFQAPTESVECELAYLAKEQGTVVVEDAEA